MKLEEWIRGMEKIFTVVEVTNEKKVNVGTFYLTREADIWWNIVQDRQLRPKFTWNEFLEELRPNFTQLWFNGRNKKNLWN